MFRHQCGLESIDGAFHEPKVFPIDSIDRTQSESHAVQAERVLATRALQRPNRRPAFVEIILGVRLDPANGRTFVIERLVMDGPEADPGARRDRPA
jgi:hypothetical protein